MTTQPGALALTRRANRLLRRTLPQALTFDLALKLLVFAVVAPAITLFARLLFGLGGHKAIANTDVAAFALSPLGITTLLAIATLALAVTIADYAGIATIAYGAVHERRVSWHAALRGLLPRAPAIVRVSFGFLLRTAALAAPFLVGLGLVYWLLLTEHDINFYLVQKPPEWYWALGIGAVLGIALLVLLVTRLSSWSLALPLVLFGAVPPGAAFAESRALIRPRLLRAVLLLVGWAVFVSLATALATGIVALLGSLSLDLVGERLRMTAAVLGLFAALEAVLLLLANALGAALAFHLATALYEASLSEQETQLPIPPGDAEPLPERPEWKIGGRTRLLAAAGLGVGAAVIALGLLSGIRSPDDVRNIAHRAAALLGPENSLGAMRGAIAAGAEWAEIDVQRTADDHVVVIHDRDLMKLAGEPWRIAETELDKLKTATIGDGEHVATLEEFIEVARGRIGLCVELKYYGFDPKLAERVVEILRREGVAETSEVMSLDSRAIEQMRGLAPEIRLGYLSSVALGDVSKFDVDFLAVAKGSATRTLLAAAHRRGMDVYVWTLNQADEMSDFIDRGVDGIITDAPGVLAQVLAERQEMTDIERLLLRFGALHGR